MTKVVEVEPTSTAGLSLLVAQVPLTRCQIHLQNGHVAFVHPPSRRIPPHALCKEDWAKRRPRFNQTSRDWSNLGRRSEVPGGPRRRGDAAGLYICA